MEYELGDLAQRLGRHMAEQCTDGMPGHFRDDLLAAFPDEAVVTVRSALAELNGAGLVTLDLLIGPKLPSIHTTHALFVAADAAITGHDPIEDSVILARLLIDDPELGHVPGLEEAAGWPRRRFNPALGLLMPIFRKGRYREVYQPDYPTLGLIVGDDEIEALRRYPGRRASADKPFVLRPRGQAHESAARNVNSSDNRKNRSFTNPHCHSF